MDISRFLSAQDLDAVLPLLKLVPEVLRFLPACRLRSGGRGAEGFRCSGQRSRTFSCFAPETRGAGHRLVPAPGPCY